MPSGLDRGIQWIRILDTTTLAKWEAAWNGSSIDNAPSLPPRLFLPSLLTDPDIAFIAAYRGNKIIAGAVLNRTGNVVGLSNVFTPVEDRVSFWAGCVTTAKDIFQGLPLVGYEDGQELALAQAVGFKKLQGLRVWTHRE